MDLESYISTLQSEGQLFAVAVAASSPDAKIPTCPAWTMRDLVHHQGEVHRWAARIVADGIAKPSAVPEDFLGPLPNDDDLLTWFGDISCSQLLDAFAPPNARPPADTRQSDEQRRADSV